MNSVPRAFRPMFMLYLGVGEVIHDLGDGIYDLTEDEFTGRVMFDSGGSINPATVRGVYRALKSEAFGNGERCADAPDSIKIGGIVTIDGVDCTIIGMSGRDE